MYLKLLKCLALVAALSGAIGNTTATAAGYENEHLLVTADRLAEITKIERTFALMGGPDVFRIIDVRSPSAYAEGHLPQAINIPFNELTDPDAHIKGALKPDEMLADMFIKAGLNGDTRIVLYDDQGGFRAARLFWLLEYYGHKNVGILNGGIQAWQAAGNLLVAGYARPKLTGSAGAGKSGRAKFSINRTPRRIASADWILERKDNPDVRVIDVRPADMFAGGHIPWARNIPWKGNLNPDLTMKSASELREHFLAQGISPENNVVVHCQNGEASAHTYFALRLLGYPRVRTYHRSWAEWGASDDLPKAFGMSG
ncbi:sulfurtransferase [Hoeflea sp. TYP-13]|uniref:sulfurtransferase n=1 Tax=Hoeflea sp. TYP-13 TaxID=3230023 RepID=UPI0034C6D207